jgi:metal-responsive CopG/Arc/MetJ family transcriptional regulator
MEILSISIDKEALTRLKGIQKRLGFKSRSKMLQSAILSMLKDYEALEALRGNVESIFVLTYRESEKNHVSDIFHRFEDTIKSELHQHHHGKGVSILSIDASADRTREFFRILRGSKCVYSVTYAITEQRITE